MSDLPASSALNSAGFIADHLALDFINTAARAEGVAVDFLQSDNDVIDWLKQAGLSVAAPATDFPAGRLLQQARQLRATLLALVKQKKQGEAPDLAALNHFLLSGSSHLQLVGHQDGSVTQQRVYAASSPAALLAPLAEQAAALLAEGDFALVRECEHPECVLWFYDRTKGHRRRWCSMAVCGNRAKVARFRQMQKIS